MTRKTLDLDAVRAFVLTAELASFTRAAAALGSTQSAISLKLRRLETQLGQRLLERTPRRVRLSGEGTIFLAAARPLLDAHEHALTALHREPPRRLAVGISQLLVGSQLPALLRQLVGHDPQLRIELHVGGSRELEQARAEGRLDATIVVQPAQRRPRNGELLFVERFGWLAAAGWQPHADRPLPLSTQGEACTIRNAAVRALDGVGRAWAEVFIGKGAATIGAAAAAGIAVAPLALRAAPVGTVDIGQSAALPRLPDQHVVLHGGPADHRAREGLRRLAMAFKGLR